jgi:hypothetical protein
VEKQKTLQEGIQKLQKFRHKTGCCLSNYKNNKTKNLKYRMKLQAGSKIKISGGILTQY